MGNHLKSPGYGTIASQAHRLSQAAVLCQRDTILQSALQNGEAAR